ncbi:hypothetical protein [Pseudobutyrivibrio sp.]|uniref:hypothetical protein n=1 Tax=Pseudobutyrivibrio sp. TaxID=2014367 RepID=UPI0025D88370|nr:hypothetical protein [Pseudobutyrivibrio sp.]
MAQQNKVAVNLAQDFTDTQKLQGRQNIGASQISYDNTVTDMTVTKEIVRPYMNTKYSATIGSDNFLLLPSTCSDGMVVKSNGSLQTQSVPQGLPSGGTAGQALILDANGDPIWSNSHYVSYDANQGLTSTQQKNARLNIAAVSQSQISDLHGLLYIRSLTNSYWVENPITWPANSGRHTWRGIAKWRLQPNDTLLCMLSGQLTESMNGSTEWAVSLNTSDAYPASEAFSHYFSTNGRSSAASTWTNIPGTMLSYSNGSSEQEVTLGVYNSSSALTDGSAAALYGKIYGTSGDGRMLSGPCVWYCIFNERNRGYQET